MNHNPEKEMNAQWYNGSYASEPASHYREHYSKSPFYGMWKQTCNSLKPTDKILDIGCGSGQMGHMLYDMGIKGYIGFDFSEYSIEIARGFCPLTYHVDDALTTDLFSTDYDTVVSCEFVEHINEDLKVLERIKPGTKCFISTSNSPSENHVRWFDNEQQLKDRYECLFNNFSVECYIYDNNPLWWSWIFKGVKK